MQRIVYFLLVFSILVSGATTNPTEVSPGEGEIKPGLNLVSSQPSSLTLEAHTPTYKITEISLDGNIHHQISASETETYSAPGEPEIPVLTTLISIPPDAELQVNITAKESVSLVGPFTIQPGPSPAPLQEDLVAGGWEIIPSEEIYTRNALFPSNPIQIGEPAWVRDQRVVQVQVFPFQYNPVQGSLVWNKIIRFEIHFSQPFPTDEVATQGDLSPLGQVLSQAVLNSPSAGTHFPTYTPLSEPTLTESAYKITLDQDGIYRITYTDLQNAGMDVDNIDPAQFKLTSQGQDIAIRVEGEGDGSFDPGDYITFYGQKFYGDKLAADYAATMNGWLDECNRCELKDVLEKYTDENVYWLQLDPSGGTRMSTTDGTPDGSTVPGYYTATVHAEESNEWYTHHFSSADTWFWERVKDTAEHTYSTSVDAIATAAPDDITISGEIVSRNTGLHNTNLYFNSIANVLEEKFWVGKSDYDFSEQVPLAKLNEGNNDILFSSDDFDDLYFNWFEITYPRLFQAKNEELTFQYDESAQSWQYEIGNFTTSTTVEVYDITNPIAPVQITSPDFTGGSVTFTGNHAAETNYIVVGNNVPQTPSQITSYTPPDVAAYPEAEYIVITHADFITEAQNLANYRATQGLSTLVLDVKDLYNTFNYGIYHPIAIKNFLAYTFDNWSTPPSYAVLIGNGHFNLKNYTGTTKWDTVETNFMLPNLAFVDPWQGEVDSTNLLATIVGSDPLPDLAIGRIPVDTGAELTTVINKIIAYEALVSQSWQDHVIHVADNTPDISGDFPAELDSLSEAYLPSPRYQTDTIYLDDYCDPGDSPANCTASTVDFVNALNTTGALLVTYNGHASLDSWASEQVFVNDDIPSLTNITQLSIFLSLDCLDGFWVYPNKPSLIAESVEAANGGAVSAFSPTGLGVSSGHLNLAKGFYEALFENHILNLGETALASKLRVYETGNNLDLLQTYTIFGDPALTIQKRGSISDYVWLDQDGEGDQDEAAAGIENVRVYLDENSNAQYDAGEPNALTNSDGAYAITGLDAGTYTVRVDSTTVPAGYTLTTGNDPHQVTLTAGEDYYKSDFGYDDDPLDVSIGNYVWLDQDGEGDQDEAAAGIENVRVYIDENSNSQYDGGEANTLTNSSGVYVISGLPTGTYTVRVDNNTIPAGYTLTTANIPYTAVLNTPGQVDNGANFGYDDDPNDASIGNYVWLDQDGEGDQDEAAAGIENVRVYIDENNNAQFDVGEPNAITNSDGAYVITDLDPGTYTVRVDNNTIPAGYELTTANNPHNVTLTVGQAHNDADFGYTYQFLIYLPFITRNP